MEDPQQLRIGFINDSFVVHAARVGEPSYCLQRYFQGCGGADAQYRVGNESYVDLDTVMPGFVFSDSNQYRNITPKISTLRGAFL